jgi:hypothetical protein
MKKVKDPKGKGEHKVCHNPCTVCNKTGQLEDKEVCPACGGTGCRDKMFCDPAGGLACEPDA